MSSNYKKQLISHLLDWYEDSPSYVRGELPTRRRIMRLYENGNSDLPEYNIENPAVRKDINGAVLELAESGLVGYEWLPGQEGHIMARAWLLFDNLPEAYRVAGREEKWLLANEVLSELQALLEASTEKWAKAWAQERIAEITRKRAVGAALPQDTAERQDLFKAILALNSGRELETFERVFSINTFGDSKRFEQSVRSRLIRILRKHLVLENDCTDEMVLRLVGLCRAPEQFEFSGSIVLVMPQGQIDFSLLPQGAIITSDSVKAGSFVCSPEIERVGSIENRTNYVDYVHKYQLPNELVINHGGQYSPAKKIFLQKICTALPEGCRFYHWGDIDFGGFSMLARLRREIASEALPYRMGIAELRKYSEYCADFGKSYAARLSSLLSLPELHDCTDCIKYMLKSCVRLEQEAMLT